MITLVDELTGIRVTGYFNPDAKLKVTEEVFFHDDDCEVCAYLTKVDPELILGQYKLEVEGYWQGLLIVEIPVDERYEGEILTVAYCEDGELKALNLKVEDGYIRFRTEKLWAYTVLDGIYTVAWINGVQVLVDENGIPIRTIDESKELILKPAEKVLHPDPSDDVSGEASLKVNWLLLGALLLFLLLLLFIAVFVFVVWKRRRKNNKSAAPLPPLMTVQGDSSSTPPPTHTAACTVKSRRPFSPQRSRVCAEEKRILDLFPEQSLLDGLLYGHAGHRCAGNAVHLQALFSIMWSAIFRPACPFR